MLFPVIYMLGTSLCTLSGKGQQGGAKHAASFAILSYNPDNLLNKVCNDRLNATCTGCIVKRHGIAYYGSQTLPVSSLDLHALGSSTTLVADVSVAYFGSSHVQHKRCYRVCNVCSSAPVKSTLSNFIPLCIHCERRCLCTVVGQVAAQDLKIRHGIVPCCPKNNISHVRSNPVHGCVVVRVCGPVHGDAKARCCTSSPPA
jgi:hypothetical protein